MTSLNNPLVKAYNEGYEAFVSKKPESCNPYLPSGHERDMTLEDECQAAWYSGYWDAQEEKQNGR